MSAVERKDRVPGEHRAEAATPHPEGSGRRGLYCLGIRLWGERMSHPCSRAAYAEARR